jgi:SOS-response transcriptional repressor LexA
MVDGEVTLKKFQKTKDLITLQPANESIKPIEVRPGADIKILGVLVGVLRKC